MASEEELARWKAIYERLLDEGADYELVCRAWPALTLVPLHNAEYGLFHWGTARKSLRALEKGEACVSACKSLASAGRRCSHCCVLLTGAVPAGLMQRELFFRDADGEREHVFPPTSYALWTVVDTDMDNGFPQETSSTRVQISGPSPMPLHHLGSQVSGVVRQTIHHGVC